MSEDIKVLLEEQGKALKALQDNKEEMKKSQDVLLRVTEDKLTKTIADLELQKQEAIRQKENIANLELSLQKMSMTSGSEIKKGTEFNKKFREFLNSNEKYFADFEDTKTLRTDILPQGGYAVRPEWSGRFIEKIFETSPVRPYAFVGTTNSDTVDLMIDINEAGANRGTQGGTPSETSTPELGLKKITVKEYEAYPALTNQSIEDPFFNLEGWLTRKVSEKISRLENYDFLWGNGINAPEGIIGYPAKSTSSTYTTGTVQYVLSGTAGDFSVDNLIDLYTSLKSEYRQNANWYMNSTTFASLLKKKDGISNYLLNPVVTNSPVFSFYGRPIVFWEDAPATNDATNPYPIIFADLSRGYSIYDRAGIRIQRDPFTNPRLVKIYVSKRTAGGICNYEAIKLLKSHNS